MPQVKSLLHFANGVLFAVPAAIFTSQEAIKNLANYQGDNVLNFFGPLVGSCVAFTYGYGLSVIGHPLIPAALGFGIYASSRVTKYEDEKNLK